MCKENSPEENAQMNNIDLEYNEIDSSEEPLTGLIKINRATLTAFIKGLSADSSTEESFTTPEMAIKIIDYIYQLKHRTSVTMGQADKSVTAWYKVPVQTKPILARNTRTQTMDEIILNLEGEYDLKSILMD